MENMDQNAQITIVTEDGSEILCDILFTFHSDETGYAYVVYTPVGNDDDDDSLYAARYTENEDEEGGELQFIESEEEWEMIEEVIHTFMDELDEN